MFIDQTKEKKALVLVNDRGENGKYKVLHQGERDRANSSMTMRAVANDLKLDLGVTRLVNDNKSNGTNIFKFSRGCLEPEE